MNYQSAIRVLFSTGLLLYLVISGNYGVVCAAGFPFPSLNSDSGAEIITTGFYQILPPYGYAPVRIESRNQNPRALRIIVSSVTEGRSRMGISRSSAVWSLSFPTGSGQADLLVPVRFHAGNSVLRGSLSLRFNGAGLNEALTQGLTNVSNLLGAMILLDESISNELRVRVQNKFGQSKRGSSHQISQVDFRNGPASWLGLAAADQIWMTEEGWERLDAQRRAALRDWMLRGGRLQLIREAEASGGGEIRAGLGRLIRYAKPNADRVVEEMRADGGTLGELLGESYRPGRFGPRDAAGTIEVNWGLYMILMFALVIVAGPLNLFVLAGGNKRHRLFITTPLISLGAGVAFLILIIVQDGIGGRLWRKTFVLLVPEENRELTITEQTARTGLLLSDRFKRDLDTLVLATNSKESGDPQPLATSELPGGVMTGWFQSRKISGMHLQRVRPSGARVEFVPASEEDGPWAVSTIESDLINLNLMAADGSCWHARLLPAGGRMRLEPINKPAFLRALDAFHNALGPLPKRLADKDFFNRPGTFFAASEAGGKFAIPTLALRVASDEAHICGTLGACYNAVQ